MTRLLLSLVIIIMGNFAYGQSEKSVPNIEEITSEMNKANKSLQKQIEKVKSRLEKKLKKAYPELTKQQLDSLSKATTDSIPHEFKELLLQDTVLNQLKKWKEEIKEDLNLTPPNLEIAKDLHVSIEELDKLEDLYKKLKIPELNSSKIQEVSNQLLSRTEFSDLATKAKDLKSLVSEYKDGFNGIDEKILSQLSNLDEVKLLQEQQRKMAQYKPLPEGYREKLDGFQTNDFVKEKLEAKAEMIEKIGGPSLQEKFDAAQTKMADAKEKFGSLESLKDAPKRPPNPYKDDPYLKRIKWGGNFQLGKNNSTTVDIAGQAAYLLNARARFGLGVSYRLEIGKDFKYVDFNNQVLGTRAFLDYTVFKSIYLEGLGQWDRHKPKASNNEISSKPVWTPAAMLGAGNRFKLTKKLNGNFTALYNFLHNEKSTNPSPWVFRVGFEF